MSTLQIAFCLIAVSVPLLIWLTMPFWRIVIAGQWLTELKMMPVQATIPLLLGLLLVIIGSAMISGLVVQRSDLTMRAVGGGIFVIGFVLLKIGKSRDKSAKS